MHLHRSPGGGHFGDGNSEKGAPKARGEAPEARGKAPVQVGGCPYPPPQCPLTGKSEPAGVRLPDCRLTAFQTHRRLVIWVGSVFPVSGC